MSIENIAVGVGAVNVWPAGYQNGSGFDPKTIYDKSGDDVEQFSDIVASQELLAKLVQAFSLVSALVRTLGFAAGAFTQLAGDNPGHQKRRQRYPVLGIGNGQSSDRRQKIIVEGQGGQHRHENS